MRTTNEVIEEAKKLEKWGCQISRRTYDWSMTKPSTENEVRLPSLGESIEIELGCSNPHYLETVRIYRPLMDAIMFAESGQTHCSNCGAEFIIADGDIPSSTGIITTSCPNPKCNRGSWLQEIPMRWTTVPVRVTFNTKKIRRKLEDRLRKEKDDRLFVATKALYRALDNR